MADSVLIPQPQIQSRAEDRPVSFLNGFLRLIPGVLLLAKRIDATGGQADTSAIRASASITSIMAPMQSPVTPPRRCTKARRMRR